MIAAWTGVHPDPKPLLRSKVIQYLIVQGNEGVEEGAGGIESEGQAPFREIDLNAVGALVQTPPDISDMPRRRGLL